MTLRTLNYGNYGIVHIFWAVQDLYYQPYGLELCGLGFAVVRVLGICGFSSAIPGIPGFL